MKCTKLINFKIGVVLLIRGVIMCGGGRPHVSVDGYHRTSRGFAPHVGTKHHSLRVNVDKCLYLSDGLSQGEL